MVKSAAKKLMWVGRATTFMVGLAVILALSVGLASTALAGTGVGATFNLGKTNTVNAVSKLAGSVVGPSLLIDNNSAEFGATALRLEVEPDRPPLTVSSDRKVVNLNADRLDDREASSFADGINGKATDADKLDGRDSMAFVGATRPMSVVAAGTISFDGTVLEATSNVTVQRNATGRYQIGISGADNYFFSDFVAVATAVGDNRVARTNSFQGDMVVETQDMAGANADAIFTFVVYDAG